MILNLTRELGVNLADIEIILNMRDKMAEMQSQMEAFHIKCRCKEMTMATKPRKRAKAGYGD